MAAPIQHRSGGGGGGNPSLFHPGSPSSTLSASSSLSLGSVGVGSGHQRGAKWINPCRVPEAKVVADGSGFDKIPEAAPDRELIKQISDSARAAFSYADTFKLQYALETFNLDFGALEEMYRDNHYAWLPSRDDIPKALGEPAPAAHLDSLRFESTLRQLYEFFQRYSVGLEQMLLDLSIYGGSHLENFKKLESLIGAVLCELQIAMLEKAVEQNPDVTRVIMTEEMRDIENDLQRNVRDWIIFRDLLNALEYADQAMAHLASKAPRDVDVDVDGGDDYYGDDDKAE